MVDNVFSGFNLHKLDDGTCIRHFPTATPDAYVIRQVSLTEASKVVVGGSDHGAVYVWNKETGTVLGLLQHAAEGFVQTVTVSLCNWWFLPALMLKQSHEHDGMSTIACASSSSTGKISVWRYKEHLAGPKRQEWSLWSMIQTMMQVFALLALFQIFFSVK